MRTTLFRFLFMAACLSAVASTMAEGAREETSAAGLDLNQLSRIVIAAEAHAVEQTAGRVLAENLARLYGTAEVIHSAGEFPSPTLFLGRGAALASGWVTEEELNRVQYDGFVMKVSGDAAVIAGYAPQGTLYGVHRFLREAGIRRYPWRNGPGNEVEVLDPLPGGMLAAFEKHETPFFDYRALLGWLDRGRWGATLNGPGGLATFRSLQDHEFFAGKGWLGADHTAPYLVPMALHREAHPEYYAMRSNGTRLPADTRNMRVTLCLSNPDVHRIASERALEWIRQNPERRFFYISDGDSDQCRCPDCLAIDPFPGQSADRYLQWVNSVAGEIGKEFPEVQVLTLAYGSSVKPPRDTTPLPNVVVMYCPWYWNSRGTSATTWANPFNQTAMREFTEWNTKFPGQVGVYDYPDTWALGMAKRIQFLARRGVRVYYSCGGAGDLLQWLGSQLLWDPLLDITDLTKEFMIAYYGPAAEPMRELARLKDDTVTRFLFHRRDVFDDPGYLERAQRLLDSAEAVATDADPLAERRILTSVYDEKWYILRRTHPRKGARPLRRTPERHDEDVRHFTALARRISALLGDPKQYAARSFHTAFSNRMESLDLDLSVETETGAGSSENVFDHAIASVDEYTRRVAAETEGPSGEVAEPLVLDTRDPAEAERWIADGSRPGLIEPVQTVEIEVADDTRRRGVTLKAPLSRLPEIRVNTLSMHAGRFFVEREFDAAWNISGRRFLNFHLIVSGGDVPATIYVNGLHCDIDLHEGEQIARVDLSLFRENQFDFDAWDGDIQFLGIELWPRDNFYPFDAVCDVELTLLSVRADNNAVPSPESLPDSGKGLWMSRTEPNIPRGIAIPKEHWDALLQRQRYRHVGLDYGSRWKSPRFRTWTKYRILSPVRTIHIGSDATEGDRAAAEEFQDALETLFGVRLPIRPLGDEGEVSAGNRIYVGRSAANAVRAIREKDFSAAGERGFAIEAGAGRIALAGGDEAATLAAVRRYLDDFGILFPGEPPVWDRGDAEPFLHELFLVDRPFFENFPLPGVSGRDPQRFDPRDVAQCRALAERVKDLARDGVRRIPAEWVREAVDSPLTRAVINRLLWNPFDDVTARIRSYEKHYGSKEPANRSATVETRKD